jgi:hypothetical protein
MPAGQLPLFRQRCSHSLFDATMAGPIAAAKPERSQS